MVDTGLPLFRIEAGSGKVQVDQLQGSLEVLYGAVAVDAVFELVEVRVHGKVFAGEHLGHDGAGEAGDTAVALELGKNAVVEGSKVVCRNQGQAAVLVNIEENLVLLIIGGIDNHLHAVLQRPLGGTVDGAFHLLHLAALELGRVQEGLGNLFPFRSGNFGGLHFLHHLEQLLRGGGGDAFLFGTGIDDDQVVRAEELGGTLAEGLGVDLADEHLEEFQFVRGLHQRPLVEEVADHRIDEFRILTGFGAVGAGLQHGQIVCFHAVEFSIRNAVALQADQLRIEGTETFQDVVFLQGHFTINGVYVFIDEVAYTEGTAQIRGAGLGGDILETFPHNHADGVLDGIRSLTQIGGVEALRGSCAVPEKFDGWIGGFRVRDDAHARLGVVCNALDGLREGIFLGGDDAEDFLDLGFRTGHINVTHHNHGLIGGVIPGVVEVHQGFIFECLQVLLLTDERYLSQMAVRPEIIGEGGLHRTPLGVAAGAAFLDDDATLGVNLLGLAEDVVGIVGQDEQAAVHHALALHGDVVQHVLRFLEARGSVDVAAEFRADGAQVIQDTLAGEMLGPVEAHVLQEVGQAVLFGLFFKHGARIGGQVELRAAGGKFVVADVIGESVVQMADGHLVRIGDLRHLGNHRLHLLAGRLLGHCHETCQGKDA